MKKILIYGFILILLTLTAQGAKWRVNNGNSSAHFTNLTDAYEAASDGDTIYIEGSALQYTAPNVTKRLVIIGPGYFLAENSNTQANTNSARLTGFNFSAGSNGSTLEGVHVNGQIAIYADSITLKRNYVYGHGYKAVYLTGNTRGAVITQNYITNYSYFESEGALTIESESASHIVSNNYMSNLYDTIYNSLRMNNNSQAQIINNVFGSKVIVKNSSFHNNILIAGDADITGSFVTNNIGNSTQFPQGDNLQNIDMEAVFDFSNPSTDGKFQLIGEAGTNPAIAYGVLGEDCGMFGGNLPYVLSGVPALPAIYFFFAPPSASSASGLPTSVKIKSNR